MKNALALVYTNSVSTNSVNDKNGFHTLSESEKFTSILVGLNLPAAYQLIQHEHNIIRFFRFQALFIAPKIFVPYIYNRLRKTAEF